MGSKNDFFRKMKKIKLVKFSWIKIFKQFSSIKSSNWLKKGWNLLFSGSLFKIISFQNQKISFLVSQNSFKSFFSKFLNFRALNFRARIGFGTENTKYVTKIFSKKRGWVSRKLKRALTLWRHHLNEESIRPTFVSRDGWCHVIYQSELAVSTNTSNRQNYSWL